LLDCRYITILDPARKLIIKDNEEQDMREVSFLLIAAAIIGSFFVGMSYKEADIVRSCDNYNSFIAADARYACKLSHEIQDR